MSPCRLPGTLALLLALAAATACNNGAAPIAGDSYLDADVAEDAGAAVDSHGSAEVLEHDAVKKDASEKPDASTSDVLQPHVDAALDGNMPPIRANGSICSRGNDCQSGHCTEGVCCEQACAGACLSCRLLGLEGMCRAVPAGVAAKEGGCHVESASTCGLTGLCNGLGACAVYPLGTVCAASRCDAQTLFLPRICDGAGSCSAVQSASCAPYVCLNNRCGSPCLDDSVCALDAVCTPYGCMSRRITATGQLPVAAP